MRRSENAKVKCVANLMCARRLPGFLTRELSSDEQPTHTLQTIFLPPCAVFNDVPFLSVYYLYIFVSTCDRVLLLRCCCIVWHFLMKCANICARSPVTDCGAVIGLMTADICTKSWFDACTKLFLCVCIYVCMYIYNIYIYMNYIYIIYIYIYIMNYIYICIYIYYI